MQKGIKNEIEFKNILDGKKIKELNPNFQEMLFKLFENEEINIETSIECWKSKYYEKADIKIRINNTIRGISIKMGSNCSVHQERIEQFEPFLIKIGVDNHIISYFSDFIDGYIGERKVPAAAYIKHNKEKIQKIKKIFNGYYIKINLLIRFLFQGTEIQKYDCDAIIYGTPNSFLWATKEEILKYLIEHQNVNTEYINISVLYIKCYNRNLNNNMLKKKKERDIQVKWYSIAKDIKCITKLRKQD